MLSVSPNERVWLTISPNASLAKPFCLSLTSGHIWKEDSLSTPARYQQSRTGAHLFQLPSLLFWDLLTQAL